jgi:hypothetical protein
MTANGGRKHAGIHVGIWADPHWRKLSSDAQWAYTMVLSQATLTYAGTTAITIRRWSNLAAGMTPERVTAALAELADARFLVLDWDAEEVLVRTFIRNDGLWKQPKMLDAALRAAERVESPALKWALCRELQKVADLARSVLGPERGDKLAETCTAFASTLVRGVDETLPVTPGDRDSEGYVPSPGVISSPYTLHPSPFTSGGPVRSEPSPAREPVSTRGQARVAEIAGTAHSPAAHKIAETYAASCLKRPTPDLLGTIARKADECLSAGYDPDQVTQGLRDWDASDMNHPSTLTAFVHRAVNRGGAPPGTASAKAAGWDAALNTLIATPKELEP